MESQSCKKEECGYLNLGKKIVWPKPKIKWSLKSQPRSVSFQIILPTGDQMNRNQASLDSQSLRKYFFRSHFVVIAYVWNWIDFILCCCLGLLSFASSVVTSKSLTNAQLPPKASSLQINCCAWTSTFFCLFLFFLAGLLQITLNGIRARPWRSGPTSSQIVLVPRLADFFCCCSSFHLFFNFVWVFLEIKVLPLWLDGSASRAGPRFIWRSTRISFR